MRCDFLGPDGRCRGPYQGFGCIRDKCAAPKKVECEFNELGFYCRKYRKFECIGKANCATLEDYMLFLDTRRKRAHASK